VTAIQYISQLGTPAAGSAAATDLVPVTQGSTGALTGTTRKMKLAEASGGVTGMLNVLAFGAVGDGTTDDTTALQAAFSAIGTNGGTVLLPLGYVFAVSRTMIVKSKTTTTGGGTLKALAQASWPTNQYWAFKNENFDASVITDTDIVFRGIDVDWSNISSAAYGHLFHIRKARRVIVEDCKTQGGSSASALLGCDDTLVQGCRMKGFLNCGPDHWDGPSNARVIGNYIESDNTAQMVNFNPDPTDPPSTGYVASGFTMTANELVSAQATARPTQIEPLRAGAYMVGATITNNVFRNCSLVIRGDVRSVTVSGNTFVDLLGTAEAITNYVFNGGTGSGITITGNVIRNPLTAAPNWGVIRTETASANVVGNVITGTGYSVDAIYRGSPAVGYAGANYAQTNPIVGQFQRGGRLDNGGSSLWGWTDASGGAVDMRLQSDNNWIFRGTDAGGSIRSYMSIFARSSTAPMLCDVPFQFNQAIRQNVAQLAAAGTVIGTATDVTANINEVTSATGGVATGIRLVAISGLKTTVINSTATTINVYPNNSGASQIDGGGVGVPTTITAGKSKTFALVSANNFRTVSVT
jgi:hypothetical protein